MNNANHCRVCPLTGSLSRSKFSKPGHSGSQNALNTSVMAFQGSNDEFDQAVELKTFGVEPAVTAARHLGEEPAQMDPYIQQDEAHSNQHEAVGWIGRGRPTPHLASTAVATFNGLITNDKFCMNRTRHLSLTWSRRPLRLRGQAIGESAYPPDENVHRGGSHETPVENSPRDESRPGRTAPMGSGLPAPSAMEHIARAGTESLLHTHTGGVS